MIIKLIMKIVAALCCSTKNHYFDLSNDVSESEKIDQLLFNTTEAETFLQFFKQNNYGLQMPEMQIF